jgi:hypothetical protein
VRFLYPPVALQASHTIAKGATIDPLKGKADLWQIKISNAGSGVHAPPVNRLGNHFHHTSNITPPTIIEALTTIRNVTRSTSRKKIAARISEKNGPVLLMGITTDTLPRSSA